jgi:hypothetical protein
MAVPRRRTPHWLPVTRWLLQSAARAVMLSVIDMSVDEGSTWENRPTSCRERWTCSS